MARKQKTIHYLYKTTCIITGRWYIGMHSTSNMDDGYMGSGKRLRYSIRKYGVDNHIKEILEFFDTREELVNREIEVVNFELIKEDMCMNLVAGGNGGFISVEGYKKGAKKMNEIINQRKKDDKEFAEKCRLAVSKALKKRHKEGKIKIPDWTGKQHSDETKKKMSENKKGTGTGEANSQYGTCWITKDSDNKKIKKEEIDIYLNEGWVKGRKIKL